MKMFKLKLMILIGISLWGTSLGGVMPPVPDKGYPVVDLTQAGNMVTQLQNMDDQYKRMQKQLDQQIYAADRLKSEIAQLKDFQNPDKVRSLLSKSNSLIAQSKDIEYTLNNETDFAKSYQGYKTLDEMQGVSVSTYDSFYKDNANMTLSTINSANTAIEDTNKAFNDDTVNSAVGAAQDHITGAKGTTQAVSGLAEINIQILQQLQAMNIQLTAMATAQNAAAAKQIQEEATEEAEARKKLDDEAVPVKVKYGSYPVKMPKF